MAPLIHWFRRDLRLADNQALWAASQASGGAVIPLFILDERLWKGRFGSAARTAFLLANLRELDASLRKFASRLIVRRGDPLECLHQLLRESEATGVYWNRDYSPFAIERDSNIKADLREQGYEAKSFKDLVIFECNEILTGEGKPYTIYSPYARRWRTTLAEQGYQVAKVPSLKPVSEHLEAVAIPSLEELGLPEPPPLPPSGEQSAQKLLAKFTETDQARIAAYHEQRDFPAKEGTSRLSPHHRLGTLSVRQALAAAERQGDGKGSETWIGELIWREFYIQVLYHYPHVLKGAFKPEYDALEWENNQALFEAWQAGKTGYPIVDAAMRQLTSEACMHNRSRMIVASFLTKDLLIDWR